MVYSQALKPVSRSTTVAGHQEASLALGADASRNAQRLSSVLGHPATNGTAQFVAEQYMQMNNMFVPALFSSPASFQGQMCSTFGYGQPGLGTVVGCVSYADDRALMFNRPNGQVVGAVSEQLRDLSGEIGQMLGK